LINKEAFGLKPYPKIGINTIRDEKTRHEICSEKVIFHGDPVSKINNKIERRSKGQDIFGIFLGCMYDKEIPFFSKMYNGKNQTVTAFIATNLKDRIFLIRENGNLNKLDLWKNMNITTDFGDMTTGTSSVKLDSYNVSDEKLDVNFLGFYSNFENDTNNKNSICVVKINEK
tara:strand:+ start:1472 stop:1987 length:516 start_codon:yes stop_codon:yes gene_type:complete